MSQISQTCGFSPEWIRRWVFNDDDVENAFVHISHSCGFSPTNINNNNNNAYFKLSKYYLYEFEHVELIMMDGQMLLDTFHIATFDVLFVYYYIVLKHSQSDEYLSMNEVVIDFCLTMMMKMQESGQS